MMGWNPFSSNIELDKEFMNEATVLEDHMLEDHMLDYDMLDYDMLDYDMLQEVTLLEQDIDIDHKIALERREYIHELERSIEDIAAIQFELSKFVFDQGENLTNIVENIENVERDTSIGVTNLEKAAEYLKDKFIILRDVTIVATGGLLGAGGLFLGGPLIGAGTIVAGISAGGAAVAGIHKLSDLKSGKSNGD